MNFVALPVRAAPMAECDAHPDLAKTHPGTGEL